jgi:chromosome segregation ATPase
MEQKAKFIIIGLAIFTLVCLFLFLQAIGSRQNLVRERDDLKTENTTLSVKLDKLASSLRGYESKITSLNRDFEDVTRQKEELQKKYEEANNAKEELVKKLKQQSVEMESSVSNRQEGFSAPQTNDAYWADVLRAKGELELQLRTLRDNLKTAQIANEQAQREKNIVELDLNNLKRENADIKRQFDYNQKLMDSLAQELVREKNDKTQIQDSYKTTKNENAMLGRELQSLNARKVGLEKRVQELQEGKNELERRLSEMEVMLTEGVTQIGGLKQRIDNIKDAKTQSVNKQEKRDSVELPVIVVRPQNPDDPSVKTGSDAIAGSGKVLGVNRDNNFVIIDLGQDAGLKVGDTLKVYRGDRAIAGIEAIQIRRNISACDIKREAEQIKIGDVVK